MKNTKTASHKSSSQLPDNFSLHQNSAAREKKSIRYPFSGPTVKLSPPCPYCSSQTGLVIIRFENDLGFVRCARCDAALYSLCGEVAR
ncbi:MAG: hypothetical protein AAF630_09995 [Cyanobacteria bacterium P01_C01_bin.38]